MSADDTPDDHSGEDDDESPGASDHDSVDDGTDFEEPVDEEQSPDVDVRERLEREADRAVESFDEGIVDLLSWVLDTETRARIYVHLRQYPDSTSEEIADGTGLYPSTVREALAELHEEDKVLRKKRENSGAGNNPYEYAAIAPSNLVSDVVDEVQSELNTVFNLDDYLGGGPDSESDTDTDTEPVTINVSEEADDPDERSTTEDVTEDEDLSAGGADGDDSDDQDDTGDQNDT